MCLLRFMRITSCPWGAVVTLIACGLVQGGPVKPARVYKRCWSYTDSGRGFREVTLAVKIAVLVIAAAIPFTGIIFLLNMPA